jgi:hypothetical protein
MLIFQRPDSTMRMCLQNLLEKKQVVPMMLAELTVNLHCFGFHVKDIQINEMIYFNDCKFLRVGSGGGRMTITFYDYYCYKF